MPYSVLARYKAAQRLVPLLFVVYSGVAIAGGLWAPKGEVFPFFNWSLFTKVSDQRSICEVEILALDGVALETPTRFYDLPKRFAAAQQRSSSIVKLAWRMAKVHKSGDVEQFARLRSVLETSYLGDVDQMTYRLVVYRYNPIERWRSGAVQSAEILGEFAVDRTR